MLTIENAANYGIEKSGVLGQTIEVLSKKQKPFLDTLAEVMHDAPKNGWEYIGKHPDTGNMEALPVGKVVPNGEKCLFTGAGLCPISTLALYDGLSALVPSYIQLGVQRMKIYFNKESRMGGLRYLEKLGEHSILRIGDTKTKQVVYVDPTYGQVRWPWAGKFLMTPDLGAFYTTDNGGTSYPTWQKRPLGTSDLIDTTDSNSVELEYQLQSMNVSKSAYQQLVDILSGKHT